MPCNLHRSIVRPGSLRAWQVPALLLVIGHAACAGNVGGSIAIDARGTGGLDTGNGGSASGGLGGERAAGGAAGGVGTGAGGAAGVGGAGAGGARDGGASDVRSDVRAGTGGIGGGVGSPDGGPGGGAGLGGLSLCVPGKYLICESFETTAVGAVPAGWTPHGSAVVAADAAARGTHALKISAANNGERRIYTDATRLGSGHWGRIFYKVQPPPPPAFVHSTIVALLGNGPVNGSEEVRVVDTVKAADSGNTPGKHQFLYNVQPNGNEFGKGSAYNYSFDGAWHCAEWHIDNPTQSYHFYYDGVEVTSIAIDNGPGVYTNSDIPVVFSQLRVGWNNYQAAPPGFIAWIDEVAIDTQRIGCDH